MGRWLDFRARARLVRIIYSKPIIILLAVFLAFIAQATWGMHKKNIDAQEKLTKSRTQLQDLENRENQLISDISRLSTERGVEEEIRDRFMVAKEGEKVIIISDPKSTAVHSVVIPEEKGSSLVRKIISAVGLSD